MYPRSMEELQEELSKWVDELNERSSDSVVVVEGVRDTESLLNIGVCLRIIHLNKGMSVLSFLETLKRGDRPFQDIGPFSVVVILTDWDRTGGRLASKLQEACKSLGLECDLDHRRKLSLMTKKWVRDVESLDSLFG